MDDEWKVDRSQLLSLVACDSTERLVHIDELAGGIGYGHSNRGVGECRPKPLFAPAPCEFSNRSVHNICLIGPNAECLTGSRCSTPRGGQYTEANGDEDPRPDASGSWPAGYVGEFRSTSGGGGARLRARRELPLLGHFSPRSFRTSSAQSQTAARPHGPGSAIVFQAGSAHGAQRRDRPAQAQLRA